MRRAPLDPLLVEPRTGSTYPAALARKVGAREKRALGDLFGLTRFGVQHVTLAPGGQSALKHAHAAQDEFVLGLSGALVVIVGEDRFALAPGHVVGFPAGGEAHHVVNESDEPGAFLVVGDRTAGDAVAYPDDDLAAEDRGEGYVYARKDGRPY